MYFNTHVRMFVDTVSQSVSMYVIIDNHLRYTICICLSKQQQFQRKQEQQNVYIKFMSRLNAHSSLMYYMFVWMDTRCGQCSQSVVALYEHFEKQKTTVVSYSVIILIHIHMNVCWFRCMFILHLFRSAYSTVLWLIGILIAVCVRS